MKNILPLIALTLMMTANSWAQCGRCGTGGGGGQTAGYVSNTTYRSPRLTALPNGNGKASVTLVARKELVGTSPVATVQLSIDYTGVSNATTVTGLEVRAGLTANSPGILVVDLTPFLAGSPVVLANGSGKVVRQGPAADISALASTLSAYSLRMQLDKSDTWVVLGSVIPVQTELVTVAALTPEAQAIAGSATGALTASIARDAIGAIASAEIRFDLRTKTVGSVFATTNITKVDVHLNGAGGPVILDVGSTRLPAALKDGSYSFPPRLIDAANNPADVQALESLLQDPTNYYFDFHTDRNPTGELGGLLQRTENYLLLLHGDPADGASEPGLADALVTVNVVRDSNGPTAGLVNFDFLYRNFNPGAVHVGMNAYDGAVQIVAEPLTFDPLVNDLTVGLSGIGGLSLRVPVLGESGLLSSLVAQNPATFGAIFNTTTGGVVALGVLSQDVIPSQPRITSITPPISTPGSIISIAGISLSGDSQVFIAGLKATVDPALSSSNKTVARVPTDIAIDSSTLNSPVFVVDRYGRASNTLNEGVDIAEPYILGLLNGVTTITQNAPLIAGNPLQIRCTGLTANTADRTKISSLLGVSVKVDGGVLPGLATVVADPIDSGYWRITVQVPSSTVAGKHSLQLVATATVTGSSGSKQAYPFPSAAVDLWTK